MLRRNHSNYSLWPEQARPRKGLPLALAVGGFAIGIVCAVAANNVISDFLRPATTAQAPAPKKPAEHTPVYATSAIPPAAAPSAAAPSAAVASADAQGDSASKSSRRPRTTTAKVTLPSIGTSSSGSGTATDGRGGDAAAPGTSSANLSLGPQPRLLRDDAKPKGQPAAAASEDPKPSAQAPVLASAPEEVKPALEPDQQAQPAEPRAERAAKPRKRIVRKKRSRPNSQYANPYRSRPYGGPTYGYYGQPVYGGFPF
jgi:hypothetical protein